MKFNWVKINYCYDKECLLNGHILIDDDKVCDLTTMPSTFGEYLVSDGSKIGIAKCDITFHNWSPYSHRVPNNNIKYWLDISDLPLPGKPNQD